MTSEQIRDDLTDNLLTPANCALAIIDYQALPAGTAALSSDGGSTICV
jgi:hypothetical protein